jgi:hypothetical protein
MRLALAGSCFPSQCPSQSQQSLSQPIGTSRVALSESNERFGKNLAFATRILAEKAMHLDAQLDPQATPRKILERALIPTVDARGVLATQRAARF